MCQNKRFLPNIVIGYDACFSMDGTVNTYNVRIFTPKGDKPDFTFQRNNSSQKFTFWGGICGTGNLFGPCFFEGDVNEGNYLEILNRLILPQLNEHFHNQLENVMFQRL